MNHKEITAFWVLATDTSAPCNKSNQNWLIDVMKLNPRLRDSFCEVVECAESLTPLGYAVASKKLVWVEFWLQQGASRTVQRRSDGYTPLHVATELGFSPGVRALCTYRITLEDSVALRAIKNRKGEIAANMENVLTRGSVAKLYSDLERFPERYHFLPPPAPVPMPAAPAVAPVHPDLSIGEWVPVELPPESEWEHINPEPKPTSSWMSFLASEF